MSEVATTAPDVPARAAAVAPVSSPGRIWDRTLVIALAVLVTLGLVSLTAPLWWTHSPTATDPLAALQGPSAQHPMGTDDVGRDVLARFLAGGRISVAVGAGVSLSVAVLGSLLGILAASARGVVDVVLMRLFDIILAFPPLILAMTVALGLGASLPSACLGVVLSSVPFLGRVVRADALRILTSGYVESAAALGAPPGRVMRRHVLPHVMPTILVQIGSAFSFAILTVAGLGFLGLGAQIPTPEWGAMITGGSALLITGQWWVSVFPGVGILTVTCAAMVATERVRSLLDPRSAARRIPG